MKCPTCTTEMKPLFMSFYCPKDCDRKPTQQGSEESENPVFQFIWSAKPYAAFKRYKGDVAVSGDYVWVDPGHAHNTRAKLYGSLSANCSYSFPPGVKITEPIILGYDAWLIRPV